MTTNFDYYFLIKKYSFINYNKTILITFLLIFYVCYY